MEFGENAQLRHLLVSCSVGCQGRRSSGDSSEGEGPIKGECAESLLCGDSIPEGNISRRKLEAAKPCQERELSLGMVFF